MLKVIWDWWSEQLGKFSSYKAVIKLDKIIENKH